MLVIRLAGFVATWLCLGCGVDEYRNVQRKDRDACEKAGGRSILDRFCVPRPDADLDAGPVGDAAVSDGAAPDAEVPVPCTGEGKEELCYDGKDLASSRQLPCKPGVRTCQGGFFGPCEGQVLPEDEQCNGSDDDCDGNVDEMLEAASDCQVDGLEGACAAGVEECRNGERKCLQKVGPQSDECNGEDDDCDGKTDEDTAVSCYPEAAVGCEKKAGKYECAGACQAGTSTCKDGKYERCAGSEVPADMDSCTEPGESSSSDEDCDGQVDEGCTCTDGASCYGGPAGTQTRAPCRAGTRACSDATHGTCEDEVKPEPETCGNQGVDNDCDGQADNIPLIGTSCAAESDAMGACKSGAVWRCVDGEQRCVDAAPAVAERCDGRVDEDCDGVVDNGFMLQTDPENCGACGVACAPSLRCCGGRCVNTTTSNSHCSICDNACATGATCCMGGCANTLSDPMNCGTCGRACTGLLKGCTNGVCTKLLL